MLDCTSCDNPARHISQSVTFSAPMTTRIFSAPTKVAPDNMPELAEAAAVITVARLDRPAVQPGDDDVAAPGVTKEGKAMNRRVEIEFINARIAEFKGGPGRDSRLIRDQLHRAHLNPPASKSSHHTARTAAPSLLSFTSLRRVSRKGRKACRYTAREIVSH